MAQKMLSFLRRISESDSGSMASTSSAVPVAREALLCDLGYQNNDDLRDTIYGDFLHFPGKRLT